MRQWFQKAIFKFMLQSEFLSTMYGIAGRCMPQHPNHDKPILVHVMVWCRQATIHYLSLHWPRFMKPHGVTRPQWGKNTWLNFRNGMYDMFWLVQWFIWKKFKFYVSYDQNQRSRVFRSIYLYLICFVIWNVHSLSKKAYTDEFLVCRHGTSISFYVICRCIYMKN